MYDRGEGALSSPHEPTPDNPASRGEKIAPRVICDGPLCVRRLASAHNLAGIQRGSVCCSYDKYFCTDARKSTHPLETWDHARPVNGWTHRGMAAYSLRSRDAPCAQCVVRRLCKSGDEYQIKTSSCPQVSQLRWASMSSLIAWRSRSHAPRDGKRGQQIFRQWELYHSRPTRIRLANGKSARSTGSPSAASWCLAAH
jgi:hypothetical protein